MVCLEYWELGVVMVMTSLGTMVGQWIWTRTFSKERG